MDKKITRRAVLGAIITCLAAGSFAMQAIWRRMLPAWIDPFVSKISKELEFPREYAGPPHIEGYPVPPPTKEVYEKICRIHKRYWSNYAKLAEVSFRYSSSGVENGRPFLSNVLFSDARINIKFGYGIDVRGKNSYGKDVHHAINVDYVDTQPEEYRFNVCSMATSCFDLWAAHPEFRTTFNNIERNVSLPDRFMQEASLKNVQLVSGDSSVQFRVNPEGLYDARVSPYTWDTDYKPLVVQKQYFSQKTGMLELKTLEALAEGQEYWAPMYTAYKNTCIDGIYFPTNIWIELWKENKKIINKRHYQQEENYSEISFKLLT